MNRSLPIRLASEVLGTALLVAIGTGTIVAGALQGGIPQWVLAVAWFVAVSVPIVLFVRVSGAHLNPMVTLALSLRRRFPMREVAPYIASQFGGAFLGTALVALLVGRAAHLGSTVPREGRELLAFSGEALFTFLLVLSVFQLLERGAGRGRWRLLLPGGVVGISTYLIGPVSGSSLNLARTLAPAVLSGTFAGLWVYVLAVPIGALSAVLAAHLLTSRG